jgi:hypothetical protein
MHLAIEKEVTRRFFGGQEKEQELEQDFKTDNRPPITIFAL